MFNSFLLVSQSAISIRLSKSHPMTIPIKPMKNHMFNNYVSHYQRVEPPFFYGFPIGFPMFLWFSYGFLRSSEGRRGAAGADGRAVGPLRHHAAALLRGTDTAATSI